MAKRSPPSPARSGSTTLTAALAAMAASTAEPPRARTCAPACDARVWLVATMPRSEITIERAWLRSCPNADACQTNKAKSGSLISPPVNRNHTSLSELELFSSELELFSSELELFSSELELFSSELELFSSELELFSMVR